MPKFFANENHHMSLKQNDKYNGLVLVIVIIIHSILLKENVDIQKNHPHIMHEDDFAFKTILLLKR